MLLVELLPKFFFVFSIILKSKPHNASHSGGPIRTIHCAAYFKDRAEDGQMILISAGFQSPECD